MSSNEGAGRGSGLLTDLQRMVLTAAMEERGISAAPPSSAKSDPPAHPSRATPDAPSVGKEELQAVGKGDAVENGTANGLSVPVSNSQHQQQHLHAHSRSVAPPKQERKSHSTVNGRPKKAGGGGKGTWGSPMDPNNYRRDALDPGDPLYDEDEDEQQYRALMVSSQPTPAAQSLESYKARVTSLVEEYFASADMAEAVDALKGLGNEEYHHHFVKRLLYTALDRHEREKEMAAQLLSALYGSVILPAQISKGFLSVLEGVDDVRLDCPDATDVLSVFLARAVVDDILPPSFLTRTAKALPEGSAALEVVKAAEVRLSSPHHAEVLEKWWGGDKGVHMTLETARERVQELLREYTVSKDVGEALRCVRDLNMPFFHHEVVKCALVRAMEQKSAEEALLALLQEGAKEGLLSSSQLDKGFARVVSTIDDLALDVPGAPAELRRFVVRALHQGWLTRQFARQVAPLGSMALIGSDASGDASRVLPEYKAKCSTIVAEYFSSGDTAEAGRCLEELAYPDLLHHFVKRLISLAMDRKNRECEMASLLLSALYDDVIPSDQMESGFVLLLEGVEDLALDIPNAPDMLALFLARAVVDDILAPHFVSGLASATPPAATDEVLAPTEAATEGSSGRAEGIESTPAAPDAGTGSAPAVAPASSSLAHEVARMAQAMLSARHAGERILRCWGGSGGITLANGPASTGTGTTPSPGAPGTSNGPEGGAAGLAPGFLGATGTPSGSTGSVQSGLAADAKEKIVRLLEEYEAGGELQEACRCLRELNMPFFHHEVVKRALVMALEKRSARPLQVLQESAAEFLITPSQMEMGLGRVSEAMADLALDIPDAAERFEEIVAKGKIAGWVPSAVASNG